MPKYVSNAVVVPGDGEPCPRCGQMMQTFEHREIGPRQRRAAFYYRRWFRCCNISCRTNVVTRAEDRVWNISGEDRTNLEQWLTKHTATKAKDHDRATS